MKQTPRAMILELGMSYDPIPECRACGRTAKLTHRLVIPTGAVPMVKFIDCCSLECAEGALVRWAVERS